MHNGLLACFCLASVGLLHDIRDVQASLAAGMQPIVARYGYLGNDQPPETWGASYLIDHPKELLTYL